MLTQSAIDLLTRVKVHILEEPLRADICDWAYRKSQQDGGPRCGTVGCIAGWCVLLSHPQEEWGDILHEVNFRIEAANLLGVNPYGDDGEMEQLNRLFNANGIEGDPRTPEHAASIARRIDGFIAAGGNPDWDKLEPEEDDGIPF